MTDSPPAPLVYLASPYSHESGGVRSERFVAVSNVAAQLVKDGHNVFSPIAHSHPLATYGFVDAFSGCWQRLDNAILAKCDELWNEVTPQILSGEWRTPYFLNWDGVFTPIEMDMWISIRCLGLPFFPQYPVSRYFVDFGDPIKRIAIECDGKQWHDADKDALRDYELECIGWQVMRFTGSQCVMGEEAPESSHASLVELKRGEYGRAAPAAL